MEQKYLFNDELLNEDGTLKQVGYSSAPIVKFNKDKIKNKRQIKEWDYYYITDERFCICLCIANLGYKAVLSASIIDFYSKAIKSKRSKLWSPKDAVKFIDFSGVGETHLKTRNAEFNFEVKQDSRHLTGKFANFYQGYNENPNFEFDFTLTHAPKDSIVKVTPFNKKHQFCYSQKTNCICAEGSFTFNGKTYELNSSNAMATMFLARGVLPYSNKWYWASLQSKVGDSVLGFNLGKSFGDNDDSTENAIFYDGEMHKIGNLKINIQRDGKKRDYLGHWTFYDEDGRLELLFEPIIELNKGFNLLVLSYLPHTVFGRFSGSLTLDDGKVIEITDIMGFAERVTFRL